MIRNPLSKKSEVTTSMGKRAAAGSRTGASDARREREGAAGSSAERRAREGAAGATRAERASGAPHANEFPDMPDERGAAPAGERASLRERHAEGTRGARRARKPRRPRRPSRLALLVSAWWDRLIGAVYSGSLSSQTEQYAAHNTTRDYIWNSVGLGAWGVVFPILSIVTTQLLGTEAGGRFSMAFVTGTLLLFIANYGVRTFQVSDIEERYSFADYQANRIITCIIMLFCGLLYCQFRGYDPQMFTLCMGMFVYRAIDGLADVYEGRLQQMDKLYLAGVSQALRSGAVIVAYSVVVFVFRNLGMAGIAMAVAAAASFILLTLPLTYFETPKSAKLSLGGIKDLFVQCFPLFLALFLYNLIDNMPKFSMEGTLPYDDQLYFNALFSPAHVIIMAIGFVYKPQLMRLAEIWSDPKRRVRFDLIVLAVLALIVLLTAGMAAFMGTVGIPLTSFLYGVDFEQYRGLCYVMIVTGGVCAAIDFLYQIITVLRRQKAVTRVYLLTLGFSLFVPPLLIGFTGLTGAVLGYLIVMCILLVLLVTEYLSIHAELSESLKALRTRKRAVPEEDAE